MKEAVALSLAIVSASVGDILFSKGMRAGGEIKITTLRDIAILARDVFTHTLILTGMFSMAIHLGSYTIALAWVDVSVANPLTALSYVMTTTYAVLCMRERVNPIRWAGVLLITTGAVLVGLSS